MPPSAAERQAGNIKRAEGHAAARALALLSASGFLRVLTVPQRTGMCCTRGGGSACCTYSHNSLAAGPKLTGHRCH